MTGVVTTNNGGLALLGACVSFVSIITAVSAPLYFAIGDISTHMKMDGHPAAIERINNNNSRLTELDVKLQRELGLNREILEKSLGNLDKTVQREILDRTDALRSVIELNEKRLDKVREDVEKLKWIKNATPRVELPLQ